MSEWISVKDRPPTKEECQKYSGWFIVKRGCSTKPDISRYDGHETERAYNHGWKYPFDSDITHWMPMPDLPI